MGCTKALRKRIEEQYTFEQVMGKGSYGCVSKATCKATGRRVALKIMIKQTQTEYDAIKVLREIQLLRRLNNLSDEIGKKTGYQ